MATFASSFLLYGGILLVVSIPVMLKAHRLGKPSTVRNFAIAAGVVGVIAAVIKVTSDLLVEQCFDAGNRGCVDYGSSGLLVVFLGCYIVVALGRAWSMGR